MPECTECGHHVSADFVRVFGLDGEVSGCLNCETMADVSEAQKDE